MMATASMGSSWSDLIGQLSVNSHSISDSLKALDAFRAAASDVSPEAIASLEMRENAVTFLLEMSNEAMNDICGEVSRGEDDEEGGKEGQIGGWCIGSCRWGLRSGKRRRRR